MTSRTQSKEEVVRINAVSIATTGKVLVDGALTLVDQGVSLPILFAWTPNKNTSSPINDNNPTSPIPAGYSSSHNTSSRNDTIDNDTSSDEESSSCSSDEDDISSPSAPPPPSSSSTTKKKRSSPLSPILKALKGSSTTPGSSSSSSSSSSSLPSNDIKTSPGHHQSKHRGGKSSRGGSSTKKLSKSMSQSLIAPDAIPPPTSAATAYSIRLPLPDIVSLTVTPDESGGPSSISIVARGGMIFPPLVFTQGGAPDFLSTLRTYAVLSAEPTAPDTFFLYAAGGGLPHVPSAPSGKKGKGKSSSSDKKQAGHLKDNMETVGTAVKDITLGILTHFSKVTTIARDATSKALPAKPSSSESHTAAQSSGGATASGQGSSSSPTPSQLAAAASDYPPTRVPGPTGPWPGLMASSASEPATLSAGKDDFEIVAGTPATPRGKPKRAPPITLKDLHGEWTDSQGRIKDETAFRAAVFHGGVAPGARKLVWQLLFGVYPMNSTSAARAGKLRATRTASYSKLLSEWAAVTPSNPELFAKYRTRRHRIEKDVVRTDRLHPWYSAGDPDTPGTFVATTGDATADASSNPRLRSLFNVLLTYAWYRWELGYVQGMADLLSPILIVMDGDEAEAFWAFVGMMESTAGNFRKDQVGMNRQLSSLGALVGIVDPPLYAHLERVGGDNFFFCFRWLLIRFKREFAYPDIHTLWEAIWSGHLGMDHWHMFIAAAILESQRGVLLQPPKGMEFDEMLGYINSLAGHIPLQETLLMAEGMYHSLVAHFGGDPTVIAALFDPAPGAAPPPLPGMGPPPAPSGAGGGASSTMGGLLGSMAGSIRGSLRGLRRGSKRSSKSKSPREDKDQES